MSPAPVPAPPAPSGLDLDAYLARIGHAGGRAPTLETLRAIHAAHPAAIPFENLNPLLGLPVDLNLAALQAKLVTGGRGGYCYEHNSLLRAALEAMGFAVTGLAARVLWQAAPDAPLRGRSHMLLRVDLLEGPFIVDVGFGGQVATAPLALKPGLAQDTPHERFRLVEVGAEFDLEFEADEDWRKLYRFSLEPFIAGDYEVMNWFSAAHPTSLFRSTLLAARATAQARWTLSNGRLTVRKTGAAPVQRDLTTVSELSAVLARDFGLTLPAGMEALKATLGLMD